MRIKIIKIIFTRFISPLEGEKKKRVFLFLSYVGNIGKVIDHFPSLRLKLLEKYPGQDYKNGAEDYARLNGFRG